MTRSNPTHQELFQAIAELPPEALPDLATFIEYLKVRTNSKSNNFLMSIAGLGASEETDTSERDEEILASEFKSTIF